MFTRYLNASPEKWRWVSLARWACWHPACQLYNRFFYNNSDAKPIGVVVVIVVVIVVIVVVVVVVVIALIVVTVGASKVAYIVDDF